MSPIHRYEAPEPQDNAAGHMPGTPERPSEHEEEVRQQRRQPAPWAGLGAKLLRGVVYDGPADVWNQLVHHQVALKQYFGQLALDVIIDEREGYAFLRQQLNEQGQVINSLVTRRELTYEQSLACVILREMLDEFDEAMTDSRHLYITPKQFRDRLELLFGERSNQLKLHREIDQNLKHMESMGFLKAVDRKAADKDEHRYQVMRIIKARVTADALALFKEQLEEDAQARNTQE